MSFTVLSFVTACLAGILAFLIVHILLRNRGCLKAFGTRLAVFGCALCLVRLVFTPEFPFTKTWDVPSVLNKAYSAFCLEPIRLGPWELSRAEVFMLVWPVGTAIALAVFLAQYFGRRRSIFRWGRPASLRTQAILRQVQREFPRKVPVTLFIHPKADGPMGVGLFSRLIVLPGEDYADWELYHMLKHEYAHFYLHHLPVKLLTLLACCVFWWNPAVYLLHRDVSQMLEISCDQAITQGCTKKKKKEYLSVIFELIKEDGGEEVQSPPPLMAGLLRRPRKRAMTERFDMVMYPGKPAKPWLRSLVAGLFLMVFLLSYGVVLQPEYFPPKEEVLQIEKDVKVSTDSAYILKKADGSYYEVWPEQTPYPIEKEIAEMFAKTGVEIREETEP